MKTTGKVRKQVYAIIDEICDQAPWRDPFYEIKEIPEDDDSCAVIKMFNEDVRKSGKNGCMLYEVKTLEEEPSEELRKAMGKIDFDLEIKFRGLGTDKFSSGSKMIQSQYVIDEHYYVMLNIADFDFLAEKWNWAKAIQAQEG